VARIVEVEHAALQPGQGLGGAAHLDALLEAAARIAFASRRQAQRQQVPTHHLGAGRQLEAQRVARARAVVHQGLERQPFQPCAVGHPGGQHLQRGVAATAIEARGTRRGEQRVCAGVDPCRQRQLIAAHDAAGRMHEHVVADARAFGVQALQHPQRPAVHAASDGAGKRRRGGVGIGTVVQVEAAEPGHGMRAERGRDVGARAIGRNSSRSLGPRGAGLGRVAGPRLTTCVRRMRSAPDVA